MSEKSPDINLKKKNKKWIFKLAIKLLIVAIAIAGLSFLSNMPEKEQDNSATEPEPVDVTVMEVATLPEYADTFSLPGVVEPNRIVSISAEVSGSIETLPYQKGSKIEKDKTLVKLNTDLLQQQVKIAQAQLDRDTFTLERIEPLVDTNAAPEIDLINAQSAKNISEAQLADANTRLEKAEICSPISGTLNSLPVEEGEYIQPGMLVAEIVETDPVKVVVDVPERDIAYFTVGGKADVSFEYRGEEKTLEGQITFIDKLADQITRSTSIEITLENKDDYLYSGQIVQVHLQRRILKDAVFIPLSAVIPMENGYVVYVVNSKQAIRREVKLGVTRADRIQIESGLEGGDKLIIAGHRFISPEQKVNVIMENE